MLNAYHSSFDADTDYDQQNRLLNDIQHGWDLRNALIDLYLSVKIRTNDEIDTYNQDQLSVERTEL